MTSVGPLDAYQARLFAGALATDQAQDRAAVALQRLWEKLGEAALPAGLMARLFGSPAPVPKGLYIYGPVGRGKTMLMDLFYDALPGTMKKRRVHFAAFMLEVHARLHALRGQGHGADAVEILADEVIRDTKLLCFDEFQVTDIADAMILARLFSDLFGRGLIVVATSNTPPDRLYEGGLQRALFLPFIALLTDHVDVVEVAGSSDHRLGRLSGRLVYLVPANAASEAELGAIFKDLAAGAAPHPATIPVGQGRHLTVPRAGPGVAWFDAASLLDDAVGAADYLALVAHYDALIVSSIPKLAAEQRNEARRLIQLVDIIYDARARLIASAACTPEEIYETGLHAEEFHRTASRLNEMQSADWVKAAEARTRASIN